MIRVFRTLLIAAVNAIKEFFAFATDNGESQEGDTVKLNDGMATSNYDWSAYPNDNNPGILWNQPTLSSNGTLGGSSFAVSLTNEYSSNYAAWKAFDNVDNTCLYTTTIPADLILYNPQPLKITSLHWIVYDNNRRPTNWEWYGSDDNVTYTLLNSGTNTLNEFTLSLTGGYYKYHKFKTLTANNFLNAKQINLTAYTEAPFSVTGTVEKVKQIGNDFVYGMQEPEQDNKNVTVSTGKFYYAYTNENDQSVYATDNPVLGGKFTLENATVVGTLTEDKGIYSGFTSTNVNYLKTYSNFYPQDNWEIGVDFITGNDISTAQYFIALHNDYSWTLGIYQGKVYYWFSNNGTSWTTNGGSGTNTISANTHYQFKFVYDYANESGVAYIKSDNDTNFVQDYTTGKVISKNNFIKYGLNRTGGSPLLGSIDMKNSYYKIGNTTTTFGSMSTPSTLYDDTFTPLDPQPEFEVQTEGLNNITNNDCTDLGNGLYQGGSGKYLYTNFIPGLTNASEWELELVYTYKGGGTFPTLLACSDGSPANPLFISSSNGALGLYLSTNGTSSGNIAGDHKFLTQVVNTKYWIKLHYDSTNGYWIKVSTTGEYSDTKAWSNTMTTAVSCTKPMYFLNNGYNLSGYYNNSELDFEASSLSINGVKIPFYNNISSIIINSDNYIKTSENNLIQDIDSNISLVDNTTINEVTVSTPTVGYEDVPYYAYTSNNETLYTTDDPILDGDFTEPSIIYEETSANHFTALDPQPTVVNDTFEQPVLTANGTMGGDSFAVSASATYGSYYAWYPFASDANTTQAKTWAASGNTADYIMYNPTPIQITSFDITNRNEGSSCRPIVSGTVYGSNDGTNYTELTTFINNVIDGNATWNLVVNSDTAYTYYKISGVSNNTGWIGIGKIKINTLPRIYIDDVLMIRDAEYDSYERLDVPATIETSANITTSNNDNVLTNHYIFNMTKPADMTLTVQSNGINYNELPILLKKDAGLVAILKKNNVIHYLNALSMTHDYNLHYQEIQFNTNVTEPSIDFKVNGLLFNNTPYYAFVKDKIDYKVSKDGYCDFIGSLVLDYTEKDGKITSIEAPLTPMTGTVETGDYTYTIDNTGNMILTGYTGTSGNTIIPNINEI